MPARRDLRSVCVIGSGPIVIGQACEFDYAGCQALKVLREDGYRTIVVNSNPATIMTDPGFADRTYIEPLDLESVADVLRRERPDGLLPTLGGQTALNLAMALEADGVLDELGVELLGATVDVIRRAEDRELFRDAVQSCGLVVPESRIVESLDDLDGSLVPAVVRPAFTLGGHGGGFAEDLDALYRQVERGLAESPIGQVLVEESIRGWDEFELEVIRDFAESTRLWGTFEIRAAPWKAWTKKAFGKPRAWIPCRVRMPSAQAAESLSPSRPLMSKPERRV